MTRAPSPPLPVVPGLRRCPFCGSEVTPPAAVVVHQCRGVILIIRLDVWQSRPIEDDLSNQIKEVKKELQGAPRRRRRPDPEPPVELPLFSPEIGELIEQK